MRIQILILTLMSCFNSAVAETEISVVKEHCKKIANEDTKLIKIVDDSFIYKLTNESLAWERVRAVVKEDNITSERKTINKHMPEYENSILVLNEVGDFYSYYKGNGNSFPLCVVSSSAKISSNENPIIGQSLKFFQDKFGFNEAVDRIVISDIEGGSEAYIIFYKGIATTLVYKNNYID